ncbi:hypothetical protein PLESTB_000374200 [Pleodorina starrii]|uniref:AFG1-like ATPase n=1 Tax=Pleodorina starrii TaxID=330485 RepID=A0A9W6BER1_9CHLO|nr:hypothetical protein PLESTM_000020700 [Pleodorina starrii]GLC50393.1 hypothetical protein PLESTB_000374200 [Pleodorina starrii]GLC64226.1 hypothetical protein PLESTF_000138500 [Pleodorina starrii]
MRKVVCNSLRLVRAAASVGEFTRLSGVGELRTAACALLPALSCSQPLTRGLAHTAAAQPTEQDDAASPPHRHHAPLPTPAETGGPLAKYNAGLQTGLYRPDPRQQVTIQMLQDLYEDLQRAAAAHHLPGQNHNHHTNHHTNHRRSTRRRPSGLTIVDTVGGGGGDDDGPSASGRDSGGGGGFSWFASLGRALSGGGNGGAAGAAADAADAVRGLYMYGGVGCGKTMLMDLFVGTAPSHFRVLRTHFHDFMLEVHSALRRHAREADPLLTVADGIAARARVLALDELFVTDVADAMILNRLFGRLWERGLVLVATSNRPPDDLYKGGLQRNLFMPFIHRLKTQCRAHDMDSSTDYRRLAQHQRGLYFVVPRTAAKSSSSSSSSSSGSPGSGSGSDPLMERFLDVAGGVVPAPTRVEVMMGRSLEVPLAAGKACLFSFPELCGRPVAAADYLALTASFHTLALRGVPVFGAANRTEAYRFVTLIDVMYEARTRLLVTAEAPPLDLFSNIITQFDAAKRPDLAALPDVVVDDNLGFSKDRTISRLTEMQSLEYLLHHARQHEPSLVLALQEAQARNRQAAADAGH